MRTIDQAIAHVKAEEPETALTKSALRRLVVTGAIPSRRVGQKYLLALENLDAYLHASEPVAELEPPSRYGEIRRIEV